MKLWYYGGPPGPKVREIKLRETLKTDLAEVTDPVNLSTDWDEYYVEDLLWRWSSYDTG